MLRRAVLLRIAADDLGPAAIIAASSGLPLATHLGAVDPAPHRRNRAERRHDPARMVAGRGRRGPAILCHRPGVYRLLDRAPDAVRLEPRAVLSPVQRAAASGVG